MVSIIGILLFNTFSDFETFKSQNDVGTFNIILFLSMFVLTGLFYLTSWLSLNITFIKNRGNAFVIDKDGIHNTYYIKLILAFIIVVPIKTIPWKYVKDLNDNDDSGVFTISLDKKDLISRNVKTNILGKFLLVIFNFNIPGVMARKAFTPSEQKLIKSYVYTKSDYLKKDILDIKDNI